MFVLHDFVMSTLKGMAKIYPQWQVQQIALGYYAKAWILDADLAEVAAWFAPEPVIVEEPEPIIEEPEPEPAQDPEEDPEILANICEPMYNEEKAEE